MQLHSMIIDDFLTDFDSVRKALDTVEYTDTVNPIDSVSYPNIFTGIPKARLQEIETKLASIMSRAILIKTAFVRLSPAGVAVPHIAHTDAAMADYSLMLFLNRAQDCRGGTSLLVHESGMETNPETPEEVALWERDHNDLTKWSITHHCPMRPNRAFIFDSSLFHMASPVGGFGKDAVDGRVVMTCFFSTEALQ